MAFANLDPNSSVVVTDLDGNPVDGAQKPSIELRFHLGIYNARPDIGAILHAHPPYATSYAVVNRELPLVSGPGRFILKKVPLLAFAPSGSHELAEIVTAAFSDRTVLSALLSGHVLLQLVLTCTKLSITLIGPRTQPRSRFSQVCSRTSLRDD